MIEVGGKPTDLACHEDILYFLTRSTISSFVSDTRAMSSNWRSAATTAASSPACSTKTSSARSGRETRFVQINNSLTANKGTLRGLHYQLPPAAEVKVVRAIKGVLWDVIVDLRAGSPTYRKWFGAELNENNRLMMYVPRGFGHGFVTLSDHVEALYLDSAFYSPEAERGPLLR